MNATLNASSMGSTSGWPQNSHARRMGSARRRSLVKLPTRGPNEAVGKLIAQRAAEKGIKDVVFDRGGYLYHGRVKALADAAREGGLKF